MQSRRTWLVNCAHLGLAASVLPQVTAAAQLAAAQLLPGPYRSGKLLLDLEFDGQSATCLVDSGSALSLLAEPGPWSAYPATGKVRFTSASGGVKEVEKVRIDKVSAGSAIWRGVHLGRLAAGDGVQNTLGIDLLGRQPFALHFLHRVAVAFDAMQPKQAASQAGQLEVSSHGVFTIVSTFGQDPVRALFDTGSSLTAVDADFVAQHPSDFSETRQFMTGTDGLGHSITMKMFRARRVRVGPREFRHVPVVATNLQTLRDGVDRRVQAVIGLNLMRKADWFFDLPNRRWGMKT